MPQKRSRKDRREYQREAEEAFARFDARVRSGEPLELDRKLDAAVAKLDEIEKGADDEKR